MYVCTHAHKASSTFTHIYIHYMYVWHIKRTHTLDVLNFESIELRERERDLCLGNE
jgi:hypothetical protein